MNLAEEPYQPRAFNFPQEELWNFTPNENLSMTQSRLNNVMVIHVYKNYTDELCMANIGNEFVSSSSHRELQFGKFLPSD